MSKCEQCGGDIPQKTRHSKKNRFCSMSCSATSSNLKSPKRTKQYAPKDCAFCGKTFHKKANIYCDSVCAAKAQTKKTLDAWLVEPSTATAKNGGLSRTIRMHLIAESDFKCSQCGWDKINPTTGVCPLEIDHIDGDAFNNTAENLRVVCPNCHSLTSTFRALNKSTRLNRK